MDEKIPMRRCLAVCVCVDAYDYLVKEQKNVRLTDDMEDRSGNFLDLVGEEQFELLRR